MSKSTDTWKKGRGKLGVLQPLIGTWLAEADSQMGPLKCTRIFEPILGGNYIRLHATWEFSKGKYVEMAVYGMEDNSLSFWSFTSDGKKSKGNISEAKDVHPDAICFEAEMPAGTARMIYWPAEEGKMKWAVESKNKKGWKRFTEHIYRKL